MSTITDLMEFDPENLLSVTSLFSRLVCVNALTYRYYSVSMFSGRKVRIGLLKVLLKGMS